MVEKNSVLAVLIKTEVETCGLRESRFSRQQMSRKWNQPLGSQLPVTSPSSVAEKKPEAQSWHERTRGEDEGMLFPS